MYHLRARPQPPPTTSTFCLSTRINTTATMSTTSAYHPTQDTVTGDDTLYTSSLLRYGTELKQTSTLLTTMRAVLSYVTISERASLQSLI